MLLSKATTTAYAGASRLRQDGLKALGNRSMSTMALINSKEGPQKIDGSALVGMKGGDVIHDMLRQHKVGAVFGYPGGAILPVYDAIYNSPHFEFILPRHEQGAGHMAQGFARASGKPGVCLVTSGPGATNTVTPMQDALMDGTPLVVLSGQVPTTVIGSDAFQEADVVGITRSCTKWNCLVKDVSELPRRINEAFHIATTGRPGPVLLDLPKDVTAATLNQTVSVAPKLPGYQNFMQEDVAPAEVIEQTISMIQKAKRPVIYAGQGVIQSDACAELRELAHKANIPCTTSLLGLGAFDERDPLSLHMLGMHGSAYANYALQRADCIICIGARFDDRATGRLSGFAPEAVIAAEEGRGGIIHFDISKKQFNKTVTVDVTVEGDAKANLARVLEGVSFVERDAWLKEIDAWKAAHPFTYRKDDSDVMKPQHIIHEMCEQLRDRSEDVIVTSGVGQHQMWAAQFYRWRHPRSWISSGGLGTMGFGVPSAIGAKVAQPDKIVINVDGDASFCMTAMEMATAAQYNIGVKVLILNNDFQGMVKQWQDLFYDERHAHTKMFNPDFVKFAEALGCTGLRVDNYDDLPKVMQQFIETDGPVILDARVCKKEHVYPMVAAGKALDEMTLFK